MTDANPMVKPSAVPQAIPARPRVLAMGMAQAAMTDPKFTEQLPEFKTLQPKLATMQAQLRRGGCGSCRRKRIVANIYRDFLHVVGSLDQDGKTRLREYFGGTPLMLSVMNRTTKKFETITI